MNKYVKKSLKITGIVVGVAAVIYLFICIIFYFATKPMSDSIKQTNDIALQKTPITTITKNYHLSRSVESNSLVGTSKKGKKYYFIYLPHSKKAYLYQASKGKSEEQIKEIYSLYIQKDYAAYADEMLSCDDKPESYKRQIAILLEQHATEHAEEEGNVTGFEVNTIKPQANGQAAEVYLNITYANGNTEEIQLLFIHDGLRWRLR